MIQGEGIMDKLGIVHWMNLPNTPILWTTSVTNSRILSQEICFRWSQYYECSLLVSGWSHTRGISQDYFKPCEVLGGNAGCWTSMANGCPPYFNIKSVPPITYWWIWMFLQGVKISIGTHTRSGSTMINTPWHAKIDAQELFYFMILPVGRTLIDLAVSMKARLELYTDALWTLIFDKYDECSPKNRQRAHRVEVGYHWLPHETTDIAA